ncbi:zinc finger domain-containing protein [Nocardia carnea]|uniref:zinc finger domain-containing protein n=1 Tax=Nocardia carnea TaxID=37328 RepID=UPI003D79150A
MASHQRCRGDRLVIALPPRLRVRLYERDAAERRLALTIPCPYPRCRAPLGRPCTRTDISGNRHETRLTHSSRINTAKRESAQKHIVNPISSRRSRLLRTRKTARRALPPRRPAQTPAPAARREATRRRAPRLPPHATAKTLART